GLAADGGVVDARAAAANEPPRLAVGRRQSGADKQFEGGDAARQLRLGQAELWQRAAAAALLEDAMGGRRGCRGGVAAVAEGGRLVGEDDLCLVDRGVAQLFQARDLGQRQFGEEAKET